MGQEKLLTVREVAIILNVSEKEIMDLAQSGVIPAYKVGGVFLRFKKEQVDEYRKNHHNLHKKSAEKEAARPQDKIRDFFYFNDFYILTAALIILLGFLVYRGF